MVNEERRWQYAPSQSLTQGVVQEFARRFNQDLEVVVEAAIQGGEHGVLVVWTGVRYEISISPEVKYGQIVERTEPWTL